MQPTEPRDLTELERERKRLAKEHDAAALEDVAARAEQLPPSPRRERLIYAARQNAAFARRGGPSREGHRGLAIGATILTVIPLAAIAAGAAFGDWNTAFTDYSVYNDTEQKVQVWSCTDDTCSLRDEEGSAEPDEAVHLFSAGEGDVLLISGETGKVVGCVTLPKASGDHTELIVAVSDATTCVPGAPTSVG